MTAQLIAAMQYEDRDGRPVAMSGPVVIEGVLHRVEDFFVACDRALNRRPWNVTVLAAACPICYPEAKDCRAREYAQGELFT